MADTGHYMRFVYRIRIDGRAPGTIIDAMISEATTAEDIAALRTNTTWTSRLYTGTASTCSGLPGDLGLSDVSQTWDKYITRLPIHYFCLWQLVIGSAISILWVSTRRGTRKDSRYRDDDFYSYRHVDAELHNGALLILLFSYYLGWVRRGNKDSAPLYCLRYAAAADGKFNAATRSAA